MNARNLALNLLNEIIYNNKFSNKLLNKTKEKSNLSKSDIFFVFKLVYGVIQYKIYLEYVVNKLLKTEVKNKKIFIILLMALYQFKFLNSKGYFVVNESVLLAKKIDSNYAALVNAVVRKLENKELWIVNIKNKKNIIPLTKGIPFWLYDFIKKQYGQSIADDWLNDVNNNEHLYLRLNSEIMDEKHFLNNYKELLNAEKFELTKNFYKINNKIFETDLLKYGTVYLQDPLSGLACEVLNPKSNSKIIDMCCAPGGKLSYLYNLTKGTSKIVGIEKNLSKKNILYKNLERQNIKNVEIFFIDALEYDSKELFNYVLLDAPCSGFGVIKNKPEIRLKKHNKNSFVELYNIQGKLLEKAYSMLDVNGELVYSTCTINKNENEYQINKFLNNHKDLKKTYEKQFFGYEYNTNGFYICKLIKT
ncbi:transcription antitermination factor NusB [Spiroplasma turonicum]|uniref:RNA-binding Sun protein n=1 Tax=Spiroplasma turonicum TaxID=216946 RepID=A0A0K1P5G9_9MOLU|nr:transcription antitermination factor NusB [Spiroplasma turonicum]AKU79424.1 RNA-binding Sun protein [Spiroplasma turonicum]ALX70445.1 16S rRNA (cytosine967-C5)-methyltransferase [Spiroplasma turonicum]